MCATGANACMTSNLARSGAAALLLSVLTIRRVTCTYGSTPYLSACDVFGDARRRCMSVKRLFFGDWGPNLAGC
jgi:hypothetical protein